MTANFIEDQQVERRRKPSLLYTINYRPAAYDSDFIRQMKQKPAHTRRRVRNTGTSLNFNQALPRSFFSFLKSGKPRRPAGNYRSGTGDAGKQAVGSRPRQETRKGGGFSFPFPSPMTLAVIAGTLVISLLSLHWEGISLPSGSGNFALQPGPDAEAQQNLASYAGLGPLGAAPAASPAPVSVPASVSSPAPAEIAETEGGGDIPLDLTEIFEWSSYQVQKGDSVSKIAAQFSLSMDAVIASNEIPNARRLREGEVLRIPNMDGIPYTVKKGDSLSKISKAMGVPLEVILDANDIRSDTIMQGDTLFIPGARMTPEALKLALGELFVYPVRGRLTSPFGWRNDPISGVRRYHAALDMAAGLGTPVKAALDGTISATGVNPTYGKYIILSHSGGYQSLYAHLSAVAVKQGQRVNQGSKIGEVGNTGYSTGPHLHFAVYKNGRAINPLDLLN